MLSTPATGSMSVVRVPFIGMELHYATPIAKSFTDMVFNSRRHDRKQDDRQTAACRTGSAWAGSVNTEGITKNWKVLNAGAEEGALIGAAASFGISLPWDYVDFLRNHNGGEGFVGEEYLMLWRAEELKRFNDEYQVSEYAPGLLFFGSDGGGDGYAFDTRTNSMPVVSVPFIGMDLKHARRVADTFAELLSKLGK